MATPSAGVLWWFREYRDVLAGLAAIAAILGTLVFLAGAFSPNGKGWPVPSTFGPTGGPPAERGISVVAQAKLPETGFWSGTLRILPKRRRVRFKIRVENTGTRPLTGVVAEVELGDPIVVVPEKCWHRGKPCRGSLTAGGVPLSNLQPEEWDTLIFSADVPVTIHGGTVFARMNVISDQKGKTFDLAEVVVSPTEAEEAVGDFVDKAREPLSADGKPAEVAEPSELLLLGQWPTFTFEHPHRFGQIKQYEDQVGTRPLRIKDLPYERWLQGQVVKLRGRVLERPVDEHVDDDTVRQNLELGLPGSEARLRCYIPRKPDELFLEGEELEVKAVVVAWGPEGTAKADETAADCPVAREISLSPRR